MLLYTKDGIGVHTSTIEPQVPFLQWKQFNYN